MKTHMRMSKSLPQSEMTKKKAVSCTCYSCFYSFKASQKLRITPIGKVCRFAPGEHKAVLRDIALGRKRFHPSQSRIALKRIVMSAQASLHLVHLKRI